MALLQDHEYLFINPFTGDIEREWIREFLKADDLTGNRFIGIIYDMADYQEYR
jgi:hypothetical protein